jgi:hypothetical protein
LRIRAEAKVLAQQLAALCQTIAAAAAEIRNATPMSMQPLDPKESALVRQVIDVCETAIKQAVAQPPAPLLFRKVSAQLSRRHNSSKARLQRAVPALEQRTARRRHGDCPSGVADLRTDVG